MEGHEVIPKIAESIDWEKAADFLKHLVGGVNPDEGLPVADEAAADEMQRNAPENPEGTEVAELTMRERWTSLNKHAVELMKIVSPDNIVPIQLGYSTWEEWAKASLEASRVLEDEVVAMINDPGVKEQYPELQKELEIFKTALDDYQNAESPSGEWARRKLFSAVLRIRGSLHDHGIILTTIFT